VGEEIEEYAARFATLKWKPENISDIRDRVNELNPVDRNTVLIRLADHLEHLLDLDVLYYKDAERRRYTTNNHILEEIAEKLGFPALAAGIKQSYMKSISSRIPVEFSPKHSGSFVVPPRSYRKRLSVLLVEGFYRLRSVIKWKRMFGYGASLGKGKKEA
jgi:hypothetical protein